MNLLITRAGCVLMALLMGTACSGSLIPVPTQAPAAPGAFCEQALAAGRLVADPRWGIALDDPAGFVRKVIWPYGYVARRDARLVLLDGASQVVAGEGDEVTIGGGESGSNGPWRMCSNPGSLEVLHRD